MKESAKERLSEPKPSSVGEWLRSQLSDTQRYTVIWVVTGVACGLAAVLFHQFIDLIFHMVRAGAISLGGHGLRGYLLIGLAPVAGGFLTGIILVKFAPHAVGSGIPQTKVRYYRDFGVFRLREAVWRFLVGAISIGSGMSLGREGPTVHICAAIASKLGQIFGIAKKRVQAMVPIGMGAGIAAAFNTPMAAVFFVFEELLGDFSSKSFFGIFIAVVIAAVMNRLIIGEHPAFDLELGTIQTEWWMLMCVPLGLLSAFLGRGFLATLLYVRARFRDSSIPVWLRPTFGGLGVGLVGVGVVFTTDRMGIFGIGYRDVDSVLNGQLVVLSVLVTLLLGKLVATILAYASGASGGLFAPTLFIGAMLGGVVGVIGQMIFGLENETVGAMALLGMGTLFAAIIRCPMTSIVIIWEMTGQYALILPLMGGNMLAWLVSSRLSSVPLYDALLLQDRISLRRMPHYRGDQDWKNLPISTIMTFDVVITRAEFTVSAMLKHIEKHGHRHHGYPVVDAKGDLVGMITHHEMEETNRADPGAQVGSILSDRKLVTVHPEDSIRDVAQTLVLEDVMQVPVVSRKNSRKMVGFVTLHDIARQQNAIDQSMER